MPQVFCFALETLKKSENIKEVADFIKDRKSRKDSIVIFFSKESLEEYSKFISDHDLEKFVQPIVSNSFLSTERALRVLYSDEELVWIDSDLDRCKKTSSKLKVFYAGGGINYLSDLQKMIELKGAAVEWAEVDAKKAKAGFEGGEAPLPEELKKLYEELISRIDGALRQRDGSFDAAGVPDLSAFGGDAVPTSEAAGGCGAPARSADHLAAGLFGGGGVRSSASTEASAPALGRSMPAADGSDEDWPHIP